MEAVSEVAGGEVAGTSDSSDEPDGGWALANEEVSGVEILLKKLAWPALAAEANFRNICLRGTFRTRVETS